MSKASRYISVATTVALACIGLALSPSQTLAVTHSASCSLAKHDEPTPDMSFGTDVPVIFVHGWRGSPAQWESRQGSKICDDVNALPGVSVALNFKYSDGKVINWKAQTTRLIPMINLIADKSAANGGSGKVIIVAYSLGTVITRHAFDSGKVGGKVGQVITIAALNQKLVPDENYPSGVVVKAMGGNIWTKSKWANVTTAAVDTKWDGTIGIKDALKRYTNNPEVGGGRVTAQCTETFRIMPDGRSKRAHPFSDLCEHGNLLKNPVILEGVVTGISAYVDSLPTIPTPTPTGTPAPTETPTPGPTGTLPPPTSGPTSTCSTTSQTATPSSSPNPTSSPSSTTPPPVYCG